tara:strand:+ start:1182 stop:4037 length:2856 start_codon:yes stop_codon:yes gene_type:complete
MAQQELRNSLKTGHALHWYRIDKVLGQGGFGITYLAHDPNLDQLVAIKEYLPMELAVRDGDNSVYPASSANGERYQWGLDRFIAEARTLAKFKHPAIVRVLSVFEENNTAYMVMEYEQGESLQQVLDRRKTLNEEELIPILAPLLDGLELIHASGFIHRDIKPANIYIRRDQSPVLLDFGSARQALGEQTKSLTSIVSPGYAPFEQYYSKSDRQGPWTDIYSLAATMYRAISGVMPMDAIDRSEAILKAERDIFVSAGEIGEGRYTPEFMAALDHALNFNEKKRPQTIAEWRAELGIEKRNSGLVSRTPPPLDSKTRFDAMPAPSAEVATQVATPAAIPSVRNDDAVSHVAPAPTIPAGQTQPAAPRKARWPWISAAVIALAALAFGAWTQFGAGGEVPIDRLVDAVTSLVPGGGGDDVESLVAHGDRALAAGQVYEPLAGSAIDYYRRAAELDPQNAGALQGITLIAGRMRKATERAISDGDLDKASAYLETLRKLPGQFQANQSLEEEYRDAKARNDADVVQQRRIQEFLNEAATDIAENRILAPSGDNALVRYRAIQMLDPDNAEARRGITAIVNRLVEEHEAAVAAGDFTLARRRLREIEPLHDDPQRYAALEQALAAAVERSEAQSQQAQKIDELLAAAAADLQANRLSTPAGENATDRYREVLALDADNAKARAGLEKVGDRYVSLARGAVAKRTLSKARDYIARAGSLGVADATLQQLTAQVAAAETAVVEEKATRTLEQERARLAEEARQREAEAKLRLELEAAREAAALEKRRRQEAEAKRLFEIEQNKQRQLETQQAEAAEVALEKSTLVVEFDGFDDQLEYYGLKRAEVRADVESRLNSLGYRTVLHHEANRSQNTRLFLVRFRANLNSASGVFSYAASLSLYDYVPVKANSAGSSGQRPVWNKGTTGVASQTELRRVREEYQRTMQKFATEVGRAPGRL